MIMNIQDDNKICLDANLEEYSDSNVAEVALPSKYSQRFHTDS